MRGKKKDFLYFFTMNYASFVVVFIISSEDVFQVEKAFDPDGSVFFIEWFDLLRKVILLDPLSLSLCASFSGYSIYSCSHFSVSNKQPICLFFVGSSVVFLNYAL